MIKQRPILFNTEMVQAILKNEKVQTRRTRNLEQFNAHPDKWELDLLPLKGRFVFRNIFTDEDFHIKCPYGNLGDVLWVRETFRTVWLCGIENNFTEYKAGGTNCHCQAVGDTTVEGNQIIPVSSWKPSIHMPKKECRIWLRINTISVQRLNDITDQECLKEGIMQVKECYYGYKNYYDDPYSDAVAPYVSFCGLWEKINGKGSWDKNPFVWVVEFKRIEKPIL